MKIELYFKGKSIGTVAGKIIGYPHPDTIKVDIGASGRKGTQFYKNDQNEWWMNLDTNAVGNARWL